MRGLRSIKGNRLRPNAGKVYDLTIKEPGKEKHMTIQEAITKAREGGWKPDHWSEEGETFFVSGGHETLKLNVYRVFLSPLFWQSLGKAMGWTGKAFYEDGMTLKTWKREWHHFIDKLADGGTAEQFFEELKG